MRKIIKSLPAVTCHINVDVSKLDSPDKNNKKDVGEVLKLIEGKNLNEDEISEYFTTHF